MNISQDKEAPIVAAIQMCSSHRVDENLYVAEKLIIEAARNHAKLVVLPEMFAIVGLTSQDKILEKEPFGQGKIQNFLAEQSRKNNVWIVGGTIPIESSHKDKIKAACLVFDNFGSVVARYDKIHLFDAKISESEVYNESDTTEPGNELIVIDTPIGRLGLGVCFDIRFPELFRELFNKKIDVLAIPAAFTLTTGTAHWELLARARAVENFCYVIGACQGGIHASGRKTYGNSMIIEPWGNIVSMKNGTDIGVIYAAIHPEKTRRLISPS